MNHSLNLRAEIIKLRKQEHIYVNLYDLCSGNGFLDITTKAQMTQQQKKKTRKKKSETFMLKRLLSR